MLAFFPKEQLNGPVRYGQNDSGGEKELPSLESPFVGVLLIQEETIVYANSLAGTQVGHESGKLTGAALQAFTNRFHFDDRPQLLEWIKGPTDHLDKPLRIFSPPDKVQEVLLAKQPNVHQGRPATLVQVLDVTAQGQLEKDQQLILKILGTQNRVHLPMGACVTEMLGHICRDLRIESAGIRVRSDRTFSLRDPSGTVSIFVGPPRHPCEPAHEGHDCLCGAILRSNLPPLPCFSAQGSFISNDYAKDLLQVPGLAPMLTQQKCLRDGFPSIALLPMRADGKNLGILHLASMSPNRFPVRALPYLEGLAGLIGLVLLRQKAQENLHLVKSEAQAKLRVRDEFLATISHEIRVPMNAILGFADMLTEASLGDVHREYLGIIKQKGLDLLGVLDDIADLACIEAGQLTLQNEAFQFKECVHATIAGLQPQAKAKGLSLTLSLDPAVPESVRGDGKRICQILTNLVSNTLHSASAGTVTLSVSRATPSKDHRLHLLFAVSAKSMGEGVAETGPAAPKEEISPPTRRSYNSMGLGLRIVRHLVQKMGGEIHENYKEGQANAFEFSLVFDLPPHEKANGVTQAASMGLPPPMTILLADDDITSRILFGAMLRRDGHTVVEVADGGAALVTAGSRDFDLVLMDVQMPGLDGLAATQAIRALKNEGNPTLTHRSKVPIVALTAHALREDEEACMAAGMDSYLKKPLQIQSLRACLQAFRKRKDSPGK